MGSFVVSALFTWVTLAQSPDQENAAPPDFFLEVKVNNPTPYLGQQIIYTINRYQARDFPKLPHYEDHPFTGFWNIALIQRPTYTATLAGREYRVHPTHLALFPTRPGLLIIDPARLIIPGDGARAEAVIESWPIRLQVQPLPANPPASFNGSVGQFEISARLNPAAGQANQPMILIVEISGAGNIETLVEPTLPDLPTWRLLQSEVTTDVPLSKEVVTGSRQFSWSVVPGRAGAQEIPAIEFSYFDPQANSYRTIRTASIPVTIAPDPADPAPLPAPPVRQEITLLGGDIRHIKPVPARLNTARISVETHALFHLLCLVLPVLAVGGVWGWQWRRHNRPADTLQARRRRAARQARAVLAKGKSAGADPFAVVHQALLGYLSTKLDQPMAGLTSDRLRAQLDPLDLEPALVERLQALLLEVEAGRFGPAAGRPEASQALFDRARRLIEALERAL